MVFQLLSSIICHPHWASWTKSNKDTEPRLHQLLQSIGHLLGCTKWLILCCYRCFHYSSCHQKIHHLRHSEVFYVLGCGSGHHSDEGAAPVFVGDQGRLGWRSPSRPSTTALCLETTATSNQQVFVQMFSFYSRWNRHSHRTPWVFGRVGACLLCSSIHQGCVLECSSLHDTSDS